MTEAEREEKQAQAVERLLSGEEAEVEQYRKEGRLWQSVSITTLDWTSATRRRPRVTALADTGQFTVTGGYAKINVVEIPRRRGISVFAGYDPITATLPVLLLDMPYGKGKYPTVERQCQILEWMAGRGSPINGAQAPAGIDQSPYAVALSSVGPGGNFTQLVPATYNAVAGGFEQGWYITGIQWGDSLRDQEALRRKQHLVLTLTENAPLAGANERNTSHQGSGIGRWERHIVKKRPGQSVGESVEQIVVFVMKVADQQKIVEVAKAILKHNREHKPAELKGKAVDSPLRVGSTISIPGEV
jgi:hypothetical protein